MLHKGELPGVSPGDPLPEVGGLISVPLEGAETTLYRYFLQPRGLRSLYANRRMLVVYCVYFEEAGNRYLFRLSADQVSTREGALWLRSLVDSLEPAYLAEDASTLCQSPLYLKIREFLVEGRSLQSEKRLFLAEVAAEIGGKIHFLYRSEGVEEAPARLRLPAAPGEEVALAFRLEGAVRTVTKAGVSVALGKGNKRRSLQLLVPFAGGERVLKARTDGEGWAQFAPFVLESERALRFSVPEGKRLGKTPRGSLVLRWGRPLEEPLDRLVPTLSRVGRGGEGVLSWKQTLRADLANSWDPDRGVFRCLVPGQVFPPTLESLGVVEHLEEGAPWAVDYLKEVDSLARRRASPLSVALRYVREGLGERSLCARLKVRLDELDREDPGIWTEERARLVQHAALAHARRPCSALARLVGRAAEALAYRLETTPEPTWRYQAHGRPVKTFKANTDIALPHAEAILALLYAEEVLEDFDWGLEIAARQGEHLVDVHPLDGQPPAYVLGSWKDRARMETPIRLGMALDGLFRTVGGRRLGQRVERIRHLVWSRFLSYYDSVEIAERFLILGWFTRYPPGAKMSGTLTASPGPDRMKGRVRGGGLDEATEGVNLE
jgi:hypothetical protein